MTEYPAYTYDATIEFMERDLPAFGRMLGAIDARKWLEAEQMKRSQDGGGANLSDVQDDPVALAKAAEARKNQSRGNIAAGRAALMKKVPGLMGGR